MLDSLKFTTPTPIQSQAIPVAIKGSDVMGVAQTGTGKTLAFGIPMVQRLATTKDLGLVIVPTRELALQIHESLFKLVRAQGMKSVVLIGGESVNKQRNALQRDLPNIIIGTPGRIIDHLKQKNLHLRSTRVLVLDEADRMFDMGFAPQIKEIMMQVPSERQTMLFSATMPAGIVELATKYMKQPLRVEVAPSGTTATKVKQEVFFVGRHDKTQLLSSLLHEHPGSVLIFSRTKHGAKKIAKDIRDMGHTAAEIHSNRTLNQRVDALNGFKLGKYRVLVATDIAARGIDVNRISLVINFDLPDNPEDYVHRIGRTGRAGHEGLAISFATHDQRRDIRDIERLIRQTLPVSPMPNLPNPGATYEVDTEPKKPEPFKLVGRHVRRGRRY